MTGKRDQLSHPYFVVKVFTSKQDLFTDESPVYTRSSGGVIFLSDARLDYRRDIIRLNQVRLLSPSTLLQRNLKICFFFTLKAHRGIFVNNTQKGKFQNITLCICFRGKLEQGNRIYDYLWPRHCKRIWSLSLRRLRKAPFFPVHSKSLRFEECFWKARFSLDGRASSNYKSAFQISPAYSGCGIVCHLL